MLRIAPKKESPAKNAGDPQPPSRSPNEEQAQAIPSRSAAPASDPREYEMPGPEEDGGAQGAAPAHVNAGAERTGPPDGADADLPKLQQVRVNYLDPMNGPFVCSNCIYWADQNSCHLVDGNILPDGLCNLFVSRNSHENAEPDSGEEQSALADAVEPDGEQPQQLA